MNLRVARRSFLLVSIVNRSSPYKMNLSKTSFERDEKPWGSNIAFTLLRRPDLGPLYEWQSSRKFSVSSTPSFAGHKGLTVSLKLCLNLWKFSLLSPTRNWVRIARPFGSWIPYTSLGVGWISFDNFVLKILSVGDNLISGSRVFHSDSQGKTVCTGKCYCWTRSLEPTTFTKLVMLKSAWGWARLE